MKSKRLLRAALDSAKQYYEYSGDHIGESGVEHLVQVKVWEDICENRTTFCTMETSPSDVLNWAGVPDGETIIQKCTLLDGRSRFDLVYCGEGKEAECPKGIIELKIGRTTEGFACDLSRICEFSKLANENGARIEFFASLFVERIIRPAEKSLLLSQSSLFLQDHKNYVEKLCQDRCNPHWEVCSLPYSDRHPSEEGHLLAACIAYLDL